MKRKLVKHRESKRMESKVKRKPVNARGKLLRAAAALYMLVAPVQTAVRAASLVALGRPEVTKEEARRARAAAFEFTNKLLRARDLAPVVREIFVADFAHRYVRSQAARLTREQLDRRLPLKTEKLDANMSELRRVADSMEVSLLPTGDEEFMGYPAGTRLLRVLSPVGLVLILAAEDDGLKVVWASGMRD